MSKLVLTLEEDYDFDLIGISCHNKDYRLCWELNKALKTDLFRVDDLEIKQKGKVDSFSIYEFIDDEHYLEYYLISNFGSHNYLIIEHKKVDYFLLIKGNSSPQLTKEFIHKINALTLVLTSFSIDPTTLKSKQNLIF